MGYVGSIYTKQLSNATNQGCFILGERIVKHLPDMEVTSWLLIVMVAIEVEGMGDERILSPF